jgi:alcohol dehydrogenase class IV
MQFSSMTLRNGLISGKFGAGYTNDAGQKTAVGSPYLAPSGVILDAELSLATPERLW